MQCQEGFLNSLSDFPIPRPPFLGFVEDFTRRDDFSLFHQVQIVWRFTRKFTIVLLVNTNMQAAAWDKLHDLTLPKESSLIMSGATIHLFINQHVFKKSLDFPHFLDLLPLLYLYSTGSKSCGLWFSNQIALCVYDIFELTCVKCLFILTAPVLYYNSILLCRFIIFFLFGISQLFVGLLF